MRGIFRDCCACACNGHIVVPTAKRTVKSRRLIWPLRSDALLSIVSLQPTLLKGSDVRFGTIAWVRVCWPHVRSYPDSDRNSDLRARRLSAGADVGSRSALECECRLLMLR